MVPLLGVPLMNNQEIIDNAPEGAMIFSDAENAYVKWVKPLTGIYKKEGDKYGILYWDEKFKEWDYIHAVYAAKLLSSSRSLADIKRIVELEKCGWIMEESKSILTAHGGSTVLILFKSEMDGITIDNGQTVDISFMRSDTQIITISERYEPDAILAWKKIQGLASIEELKDPKP